MSVFRRSIAPVILISLSACSSSKNREGSSESSAGGSTSIGTGGDQGAGGHDSNDNFDPELPDLPPSWEVTRVATWKHDRQAAYTLFFDDTCNPGVENQFLIVDPELTERDLVASFGAIAGDCESENRWAELQTLIAHGHEVVSHSMSHPNLTMTASATMSQMDAARQTLESGLSGYPIEFFIFPFDAFNDELVDHLRAEDYLGTRAGERGFNDAHFSDPFRIKFDVFGPGYSFYTYDDASAGTPCAGTVQGDSYDAASPACRVYILSQYVNDVVAAGGWGMRELHSVDGQAWEPVPLDEFEAHLDQLKTLSEKGDLWVATASDVIRYRFAREACGIARITGNYIDFGTKPSKECQRYATPLTLEIRALHSSPKAVEAHQDTKELDVEVSQSGGLLVTVNPLGGPVELTMTPE